MGWHFSTDTTTPGPLAQRQSAWLIAFSSSVHHPSVHMRAKFSWHRSVWCACFIFSGGYHPSVLTPEADFWAKRLPQGSVCKTGAPLLVSFWVVVTRGEGSVCLGNTTLLVDFVLVKFYSGAYCPFQSQLKCHSKPVNISVGSASSITT